MQPGETITPSGAQPPDEQAVQISHEETPVVPQQPAPTPPTQPPAPEPALQTQLSQPQTNPVQATPDPQPYMEPLPPQQLDTPEPNPHPVSDPRVSWSASEYVDHPKGSSWFLIFGLGLAVLVILIWFLTKDLVAPILIGIAGLSFGAFAGRQPEVLKYELTNEGLSIGQKFYPYVEFKSFSVMDEGVFQSVLLTPLKRFMPPITVYYDPKDEDTILNTLTDYLPVENKQHDLTDRLMKRLRF